jgi:hypothetical protein
MVWVKEIYWINEKELEAEAVITDGQYELICFAYPLELNIGDILNFNIQILNGNSIVRAFEKEYVIEKSKGTFDYYLTGELIDRKEGIVKIGDIYLQGLSYIPGDIVEGDFVSFECWRLDLI